MSTLTIFGASDDLAEFRGHAEGEIGFYGYPADIIIGDGDTALGVRLEHSGRIGWLLSCYMPDCVSDEDLWEPPAATITTAREHGPVYSPMLTVDLPDGAPVRCFMNGEEREIR